MKSILEFTLPRPEHFFHLEFQGEPQGWNRAGQGRYGHKYNASANEQKTIAWQVLAACPEIRCDDGKKRWGVRFRFFTANPRVPDWDNLAKNICDALQKIVWKNDRAIREAVVLVVPSRRPRTEMLLYHVTADYLAAWSDLR